MSYLCSGCEEISRKRRKTCGRPWPRDSMMPNVHYYLSFYKNFFLRAWNNITPMQYGMLLVAVAVIGYLLMKSGAKKHS